MCYSWMSKASYVPLARDISWFAYGRSTTEKVRGDGTYDQINNWENVHDKKEFKYSLVTALNKFLKQFRLGFSTSKQHLAYEKYVVCSGELGNNLKKSQFFIAPKFLIARTSKN